MEYVCVSIECVRVQNKLTICILNICEMPTPTAELIPIQELQREKEGEGEWEWECEREGEREQSSEQKSAQTGFMFISIVFSAKIQTWTKRIREIDMLEMT